MKYKIILLITLSFLCFFSVTSDTLAWGWSSTSSSSSGGAKPEIICAGTPGCEDTDIKKISISNNKAITVVSNLIGEAIKYTAVIAVIALMIAGMMYLLSGGEEERVKKAKKWIIWALIGVVVSISAWFIVNFINNITIY